MNTKYTLMQGDCLERMKEIPDGSVDMILTDQEIVTYYESGMSMREVATLAKTNHKRVSRILKRKGVAKRTPVGKPKNKFSSKSDLLYNNMAKHLRFDVDLNWLRQFEDFEKLKLLNNCVTKRGDRFDVTTEWYKEYVTKFYHDTNYNKLYDSWLKFGKIKYLKPSIDHIVPVSKGGGNNLDNLQFLSWFENRCKNDISQDDWDFIKLNIEEFLV